MIGVSFGRCQGWYHPSEGARAVLICQPQGFEDLCARKSLRVLAERLAGVGMPVLRYDAPGCADADGDESEPGLVGQWRQSVVDAAHWLVDRSGAQEIVVVGLRLGALLAALEAPRIPNLKGLALLAPVTSGRQYTREMAVLAKIMRPPNAVEASGADGAGIDVCGFRLARETEADLKALSLATPPVVPGLDVLILHQDGANPAALSKAYTAGGGTVTALPFAGYDDMICDPTASKVPQAALGTVVDWARGLGDMARSAQTRISGASLTAEDWTETGVVFGADEQLAGVYCVPARHDPALLPVVFLNAGMSYHIGWSRMHVRMARALAQRGIPSLRYDAAGIGDSLAGPDVDKLPLYSDIAQRNLASAIDWLQAQGYPACTVLGACSGAYTAFHATRDDARIAKAVIVNLQCFEWTAALGLEVDRWRAVRRMALAAERKAQEPTGPLGAAVARLRSAALTSVRIAGRFVKRILRGQARTGGKALADLQAIAARGTRLALVFSEGDPGLQTLEAETGPQAAGLDGLAGVSVQSIPAADHNLTPRQAQDDLLRIILDVAHAPTAAHSASGIKAAA
jgi:hypothetical protein